MNNEEAEYEVEHVTQARVEKEGKKKKLIWKYNVRVTTRQWKGYGPDDDTWEPLASFVGSEDMIERFWERANTGGRDHRDMSLFHAGEVLVPTGPPRRKPKKQESSHSNVHTTQDPSPSRILEPGPSKGDKRRRSPSIIEVKDSDDEDRPSKRARENEKLPAPSATKPPLSRSSTKKSTSLPTQQISPPTNPRLSSQKVTRAPSYDEIIPASDDELARSEPLDQTVRIVGAESAGVDEFAMDQDNTSVPSGSYVLENAPRVPSSLPAHRARAVNPRVKIAELDFTAPDGALSIKARLHGRGVHSSSVNVNESPPSRRGKSGRGSKPGPGRSSTGFMKKNTSSLLTFEKGELKTVKGRYHKDTQEGEDSQSTHADSLWGGVDEIEDNSQPLTRDPPTANELLHLAGADDNKEPLSDFEDDVAVAPPINHAAMPPSISLAETENPGALLNSESRPANWESIERAKQNLFPSSASSMPNAPAPLWKQPTMFGPLGFGSNRQPVDAATSEKAPFYINLDSSTSIPVILTDKAPSHPGSPSLEVIVANKGPPGVFYNMKAALVLLDTLRTGGPSGKIGLHPSASADQQAHFERFRSRLRAGELYAGMAGDEFLVFCSSDDSVLPQRLNISPQLLGQPGDILIGRVVIENYSGYAEAALAADNRRWAS